MASMRQASIPLCWSSMVCVAQSILPRGSVFRYQRLPHDRHQCPSHKRMKRARRQGASLSLVPGGSTLVHTPRLFACQSTHGFLQLISLPSSIPPDPCSSHSSLAQPPSPISASHPTLSGGHRPRPPTRRWSTLRHRPARARAACRLRFRSQRQVRNPRPQRALWRR
eukprot:873615-Rhodomonas_salina.3